MAESSPGLGPWWQAGPPRDREAIMVPLFSQYWVWAR
jgi:hypothetical protein